ncbi:MAG: alpha/beta fold hydrolase [Burkholderiales bacterium]
MSPAIHFLHAGGHRLEYQLLPPSRAGLPTLVFLHQGLGCLALWRDFPSQLADRTGCQTLVYSRYGYGGSETIREPRGIDFLVQEGDIVLTEMLQTLGIDDVILIGHSDGGTAALAFAGKGHRARAVVVVAPHVRDERITRDAISRHRDAWPTSVMRERMIRHHLDADSMFNSWVDVWQSDRNVGWSIEPLLPNITCPLLAIQGLDDDHGTMMQIDRINALANGPVMLEKWQGCGHDPFRDQPERMLATLATFIAQHCGHVLERRGG